MTKRLPLLVLCVLLLAVESRAETVHVEPGRKYQVWDGWGASLSWWAHVVGAWSESNRVAVADLVFDPEKGLGLNVIRYNIGGEDDPGHDHMRVGGDIPSFRPREDEPYDWTADPHQRAMLNLAIARGVNILEAFSCSPPYWMTVSGCSAGAEDASKDNLKEAYYEAYADYLTEVVRRFRDAWDIEFDTLEPFNEPTSHYWEAGKGHQGCHYEIETQEQILRLVAAQLKAKGLRTGISAADETCTEHCALSFVGYDDEVKGLVRQINTHTYNYSWDRRGLRHLADRYGKRLHMSEVSFASRVGEHGHDHEAMDGALELAASITRDLREMRPDAWVLWQPVVNETYCVWWKFNYGLLHADYMDGTETWTVTPKYHGFAQYTRFIRPGYRMIGVEAADTVAFLDEKGGRLILVAYNREEQPRTRRYDLEAFATVGPEAEIHRTSVSESMAAAGAAPIEKGGFSVDEPARSIATYVVPGVVYRGPALPRVQWLNDTATGEGPNRVEYVGDWQYNNQQAGAFVSDNHWSPDTGDVCRIHFRGAGIALYAAKGPNLGIAEVSVDEEKPVRVDFYAEERKDQQFVFSGSDLKPGEHELVIRVTGEKNPASTAAHVPVDRADIEPAPAAKSAP